MSGYRIVAGHHFAGTCDDVCTRPQSDGSPCTITWQSIAHCTTDEYIDKPDIAHIGNTNAGEIQQIREENERRELMRQHTWQALIGVAAP